MNKKSAIGMVLLVAMVLAKAFLFNYDKRNESYAGVDTFFKDASFVSSNSYLKSFSTERPVSELFASNLNAPSITDFEIVEEGSGYYSAPSSDFDDVAIANNAGQENEVIPMDYVSNTGYGLWRASEAEENRPSENDPYFEGKVPLDRGNTITGDISRLFPRNP